jgi:hypothetical protein
MISHSARSRVNLNKRHCSSTYRTITTFQKAITVDVSKPQQVGEFVKDNWQWLWTAILVPIGARLWSKRDSRSTKKQPGTHKKR